MRAAPAGEQGTTEEQGAEATTASDQAPQEDVKISDLDTAATADGDAHEYAGQEEDEARAPSLET